MKEWYFYQDQGKTLGPLSRDEIAKRISDGKLRLYDLLYFEGDEQWRMALEFNEFKDVFAKSPHVPATGKAWVLLHRKSPEAKDFVTTGPFTQEEIILKLKAGKIQYSDYAWRDGFKQWKRISNLEEFATTSSKIPAPSTPVEKILATPTESLLDKVVEIKKPVRAEPKSPPPEAEGPDLTKTPIKGNPPRSVAPSKTDGKSPSQLAADIKIKMLDRSTTKGEIVDPLGVLTPPPVPKPKQSGEASSPSNPAIPADEEVKKYVEKRRHRRGKSFWRDLSWLDYALFVFILVCFLIGAIFLNRTNKWIDFSKLTLPLKESVQEIPELSSLPPPKKAPTPPPPDEVKAPEPRKSPPPEPKAPPPPPVANQPEPPKPIAPGALVLSVQNSQGKMGFSIRSGSRDPVIIQIIGLPGQVVGSPSFYKYTRLVPKDDGLVPLDAAKLVLPAGKYVIRAIRKDLVREEKFTVGTQTPDFKKQLAISRKMHSQAIWQDRMKLMKLSEQLESYIAQKLRQPKAKAKLGDLGVLNSVTRASGAKFVLFDYWWDLKEIFDEAKTAPTSALAEKVLEVRRGLALMSIWK